MLGVAHLGSVDRRKPAQGAALRFDTGQNYRAAWWMAWVFGTCLIVSMLGNVALGLAIVRFFPLKEVVPMVLTVTDRANQIVRVEPFELKTRGFELFVQALLKSYVEKRETIDLHSEVPRWQEVNWLSSDEVWLVFKHLMEKSNKESPFERYKREGVTRSVHVKNVSRVAEHVYRVEWDSADAHLTEPRGQGNWVSTISIAFEEKAVSYEDRYMNPIGLQVVGYSVGRDDIGGQQK
jgi:type IV secretion system protein VirB8